MNIKRWCVLLLLGTLTGCASASGSQPPLGTGLHEESAKPIHQTPATEVSHHTNMALGVEARPKVQHAKSLIAQGDYAQANQILDAVLESFERVIRKDLDAVYVSVANEEEFALFNRSMAKGLKLVWLDWSFASALHTKAFLAIEQSEFSKALAILELEAVYGPFRAGAHSTRGLLLNRLRRFDDALEAYTISVQLAQRFESARNEAPIAWRGLGFTLGALGRLDDAEKAFIESLRLEPGNEPAIEGLERIRALKKKAAE